MDHPETEYDEDSEDEAFLKEIGSKTFVDEESKEFTLTEDLFEGIMDYLEKQSFDEVIFLSPF